MGTVTDVNYPSSQWAPHCSQPAASPPSTSKNSNAKSTSPIDGENGHTVKSQIVLTKEQAIEIYGLRRITPDLSVKLAEIAGKSALVAEVYSVSPKTIRDIWNRKTWTQATRQFWTEEETSVHAFEHVKAMLPAYMPGYAPTTDIMAIKQKPRGRPPGSKDSRPRKRRNLKGDGDEDSGDGEANTTSLRELRDEIAEWTTARAENITAGQNDPCDVRTRSQEWQEVKVDASMSAGPKVGDKRRAFEEPNGAEVDWIHASAGGMDSHNMAPSLLQTSQRCYQQQQQQQFQGLQQQQLSHHHHQQFATPQLLQHHHHLPLAAPPQQPLSQAAACNSNFDHYLHDAFTANEPSAPSCVAGNANIGPPPRLDLGLDECLRAMSTEGDSLMKARVTLEQAMQCSPEARVITEAQRPFKIVHVNDSWAMLCGFGQKEVLGNTLNMIQGPATDPNALRDLIQRIQAREEARTMLVNYKKGGFPFLNMLQVQPLVDQEGVVTHYMGVLEDVTLKDYLHPLAHYVRDLRASLGYTQ
mmetsp:Transcript_42138/g.98824  ORF Transcript_42138/g.98824 Transcript_42138/m.98824 type:complete len:527 (-) Transcript_42138:112-1692(-)